MANTIIVIPLATNNTAGLIFAPANSGLVTNSTGTYIATTNGLVTTASGLSLLGNTGIVVNTSGIFATGTSIPLGNSGIVSNSSGVFVLANNGLIANSSGVFVDANSGLIANSTGAFVATGNGLAVVAGAGGNVYAVGANGITVTSSGINILANTGITANTSGLFATGSVPTGNNGIVSNSSGVFVQGANGNVVTSAGVNVQANLGIVVNSSGVFVQGNNGLVVNAFGVFVQGNNGLVVNSTGVFVNANNGIVANSSGVFVNANNGIISNSSGVFVQANSGIVTNSTGVFAATGNGLAVVAGSGGNLYAVGANGISVTSAGLNVLANTGITVNSSGVFATATIPVGNNGIISNSSGVFVNANNGLVANSTGVFVNANTGLVANSTGVFVIANSGITANSSGVFTPVGNGLGVVAGAGGNVYTIGANGITITSAGINVLANNGVISNAVGVFVQANSGLVSNGAGVFVVGNSGVTVNPNGVFVATGNGLAVVAGAGGNVYVVGANGVTITAAGINVLANSGLISNSSGVFVNANTGITANSSGVFASGTAPVGNSGIVSNSSGIFANVANGLFLSGGTINVLGNTGIVVNSTGVFATGTSIPIGNNGIISNSSGVFVQGANGISVAASGVNVLANNGVVVNSSGVFANPSNGVGVSASGIYVNANNGLVVNSSGVFVVANNGVISNSSGLFVIANSGITVNSSGVFTPVGNGLAVVAGSGGNVYAVGANGITVTSAGLNVVANNGLVTNSSGVFVIANSGITVNSSGVFTPVGNGLAVVAGSGGNVYAVGANGITVTSAGLNVLANSGIFVNSSGVFAVANSGITVNSTGIYTPVGNGLAVVAGAGGNVYAVGANGITVTSAGLNVVANNGLLANSSGVFVNPNTGITVNSSGVFATASAPVGNSGIVSNSTGIFANVANGLILQSGAINVLANTGITVNSSGVFATGGGGGSADITVVGNLSSLAALSQPATNTAVTAVVMLNDTSHPIYNKSGIFTWNGANLQGYVTADIGQAIYVAPTANTSGANGAWVRHYPDRIWNFSWFGGLGNGSIVEANGFWSVFQGNTNYTSVSGPDNAVAFCNFNSLAQYFSNQNYAVTLLLTPGTYLFNLANCEKFNANIKTFRMIGYGANLINNNQWSGSGPSFIEPFPVPSYNPLSSGNYLIANANIGDNFCTLITPSQATNFVQDEIVMLGCLDIQYNGFPPNCYRNDYVRISTTPNSSNGYIQFDRILKNEYLTTFPDQANCSTIALPAGKPRIWKLNNPASVQTLVCGTQQSTLWDIDHTYEGMTIYPCSSNLFPIFPFEVAFGLTGRKFTTKNIKGVGFIESGVMEHHSIGCEIYGQPEMDKNNDSIVYEDMRLYKSANYLSCQSSSVNRLSILNSRFDYVDSLNAKNVYLRNCDITYLLGINNYYGLLNTLVFEDCRIYDMFSMTHGGGFGGPRNGSSVTIGFDSANVVYANGVISVNQASGDTWYLNMVPGQHIGLYLKDGNNNPIFAGDPGWGVVYEVSDASNGALQIYTSLPYQSLPSWVAGMDIYRGNEYIFRDCGGGDQARMFSDAERRGRRYFEYYRYMIGEDIYSGVLLPGIGGTINSISVNVIKATNTATNITYQVTFDSYQMTNNYTRDSGGIVMTIDLTKTGVRTMNLTSVTGFVNLDSLSVAGTTVANSSSATAALPNNRIIGPVPVVAYPNGNWFGYQQYQPIVEVIIDMNCGQTRQPIPANWLGQAAGLYTAAFRNDFGILP